MARRQLRSTQFHDLARILADVGGQTTLAGITAIHVDLTPNSATFTFDRGAQGETSDHVHYAFDARR